MKAYLVGGGTNGTEEYNGVYYLVTEDGMCWATQWCSDFAQARKDLYEDRASLRKDWQEKYGTEVEVLRLGEDSTTFEQLVYREEYYDADTRKGQLADGVYYSIITVKKGVWQKTEPKPIQELAAAVVETVIKKKKR